MKERRDLLEQLDPRFEVLLDSLTLKKDCQGESQVRPRSKAEQRKIGCLSGACPNTREFEREVILRLKLSPEGFRRSTFALISIVVLPVGRIGNVNSNCVLHHQVPDLAMTRFPPHIRLRPIGQEGNPDRQKLAGCT